ncbi:hypothetical protein [Lichenibacterium ramalinae]|uniref:Carboxypeptidase regulatory-like domain-containing protein n=1 Tax=Lichenibacterium ramalinae TaxID=2316527 RepID=A0A4Q2RBW9_9HYPH|nr:hypothetical protein [Lichenibacterium ramalinae]RYB02464.1 hypothetical protein D3272_21305 [Lichenibacterium ramalinae]
MLRPAQITLLPAASLAALLTLAVGVPAASAQEVQPVPAKPPLPGQVAPPGLPAPQVQSAAPGPGTAGETPKPGHGILHLSATLTADPPLVRSGLQWRVFADAAQPDGTHKVVAQSADAQPSFDLPDGRYIVHATYGYAGTMKRVDIADRVSSERFNLNAGAIEVDGTLGDAAIPADRLSIAIYVPDHNNPEAKLVVAAAKPGQVVCLPEGSYHIVSTYLDTEGVGSLTPVSSTNSTVAADLRVQAGKLLQATVKHRAAMLTLKLVKAPGGEALANTSFTVLTPGGDVIRELIGAFPSLVLAEGDYVAIARHDGRTFQSEFKVQSARDSDVEVMAH